MEIKIEPKAKEEKNIQISLCISHSNNKKLAKMSERTKSSTMDRFKNHDKFQEEILIDRK